MYQFLCSISETKALVYLFGIRRQNFLLPKKHITGKPD